MKSNRVWKALSAVLVGVLVFGAGARADVAISNLPAANALLGTEKVPVVLDGVTRIATAAQVAAAGSSVSQTFTNKAIDGGSNTLTNIPASQLVGSLNVGSLVGTLTVPNGGIGVTTLSGIAKGNGTSAFSAAAFGDVTSLISGCTNSSAQYLVSVG